MTEKILKYQLKVEDNFTINMPQGSKPLYIGELKGIPYMWCLVDYIRDISPRSFLTRKTGDKLSGKEGDYIGAFKLSDETEVFHVFEFKR